MGIVMSTAEQLREAFLASIAPEERRNVEERLTTLLETWWEAGRNNGLEEAAVTVVNHGKGFIFTEEPLTVCADAAKKIRDLKSPLKPVQQEKKPNA